MPFYILTFTDHTYKGKKCCLLTVLIHKVDTFCDVSFWYFSKEPKSGPPLPPPPSKNELALVQMKQFENKKFSNNCLVNFLVLDYVVLHRPVTKIFLGGVQNGPPEANFFKFFF